MKTFLIVVLLGISMIACAVQDEPVSSTEQSVCNPANDDCIGGHITLNTAKQMAKEFAAYKEQVESTALGFIAAGRPTCTAESKRVVRRSDQRALAEA